MELTPFPSFFSIVCLFQVKSQHDEEAVVVGHEGGKGRNSFRCGALTLQVFGMKKMAFERKINANSNNANFKTIMTSTATPMTTTTALMINDDSNDDAGYADCNR